MRGPGPADKASRRTAEPITCMEDETRIHPYN